MRVFHGDVTIQESAGFGEPQPEPVAIPGPVVVYTEAATRHHATVIIERDRALERYAQCDAALLTCRAQPQPDPRRSFWDRPQGRALRGVLIGVGIGVAGVAGYGLGRVL